MMKRLREAKVSDMALNEEDLLLCRNKRIIFSEIGKF